MIFPLIFCAFSMNSERRGDDTSAPPPPPAALLFARLGRPLSACSLPVRLLPLDFDDLRREQAHLFDAADGLVLARNLQSALGFLAVGIHCYVIIFRHIAGLSLALNHLTLRKSKHHVYFTTSSMVVSP